MKNFILVLLLVTAAMLLHAQRGTWQAVDDTSFAVCFLGDTIDVLANDIFPSGSEPELSFIGIVNPQYYRKIYITPDNRIRLIDSSYNMTDTMSCMYVFRERSNPSLVSDTGIITIFLMPNPDSILAVADTVVITHAGTSVLYNPALNDHNPLVDDTIYVQYMVIGGRTDIKLNRISDQEYKIFAGINCKAGTYRGSTTIRRKSLWPRFMSQAPVIYRVLENNIYCDLDTNNIRARINGFGNHFNDWVDGETDFEVPKGSGNRSVFNSSIWMGGLDSEGILHLAGEGQMGSGYGDWRQSDFYCGPLMDSLAYPAERDAAWERTWKVTRQQIENHINNWWKPEYHCPEAILSWPAHGDTAKGQLADYAPYEDRNHDGRYNAMSGDIPVIRGDMAIYFIFNDDRDDHKASLVEKLGLEICGMAYAFVCPGDTAFNQAIFLHYDMFNRSVNTYYNTIAGIYADMDIGYWNDDFHGCDVERNSAIGYNADSVDGTGQSWAYGDHPPAQAVTLLGGVFIDPDQADNPQLDPLGNQLCNESINGLNFGDGITDNERYGMTRFMDYWFFPMGPPWQTKPQGWTQYQLMKGYYSSIWMTDTTLIPLFYGFNQGSGDTCRFLFPGLTDSLDWGTGCYPPSGPRLWNEESSGTTPGDRKSLLLSGEFTFRPGDKQELDIAYIFALSPAGDRLASVNDLRRYIDHIATCFRKDSVPCSKTFSGTGKKVQSEKTSLKIWPNPCKGTFSLEYPATGPVSWTITDLHGRIVASGDLDAGHRISTIATELRAGLYFITLIDDDRMSHARIIITD